jgi:hypothetical protein
VFFPGFKEASLTIFSNGGHSILLGLVVLPHITDRLSCPPFIYMVHFEFEFTQRIKSQIPGLNPVFSFHIQEYFSPLNSPRDNMVQRSGGIILAFRGMTAVY